MVSEAKKKSQARWDKDNAIRFCIKLNKRTDADIIKFLEEVESKGNAE